MIRYYANLNEKIVADTVLFKEILNPYLQRNISQAARIISVNEMKLCGE